MKKVILSLFLTSIIFVCKAQEVLAEEQGVSLSYTESYVKTVNCTPDDYDIYKVVVYLKNNSGHSINISNSWLSHNGYATSCANIVQTASFGEKRNWPSSSTVSYTYYVYVKPGEGTSVNTWRLGGFNFVD